VAVAHGKRADSREKNTWKTLAFLGRYGHQSIKELQQMPSREVLLLATAVGELLEEESAETNAASNA